MMVLKTTFTSLLKVLVNRIKTFFMRLSIGLFFLLFGIYYIINGIITIIAENFGINLEHLRLIVGIVMLFGGYLILNSIKK